jgi:hypothetical protein
VSNANHSHPADDPLDQEFAPGWTEQPGDKVKGVIVEISSRDAGFGPYPIYTLELLDGYLARTKDGFTETAVAVHASRDVLRRKLSTAGIGDKIGIKYLGPPNDGARSHRYRVLKFAGDGSHVELSYDDVDNREVPVVGDERTELALAVERDEKEAMVDDYGQRISY